MIKIVELKSADAKWRDEVQADMLDQLDRARRRVEAGEYMGFTLVALVRDGSIDTVTTKTEDYIKHTGALTIALHRNLINSPTADSK